MNKHAIIHANKTAYKADIMLLKTVLKQSILTPDPQTIKDSLRKMYNRLNYCNSNNLPYVDTTTNYTDSIIIGKS